MPFTLVLDIGKTHVKLHVLDQNLQSIHHFQLDNTPLMQGLYPCFDTETHSRWLDLRMAELNDEVKKQIQSICITTHGATAALIDHRRPPEEALVLPILDYESDCVDALREAYRPHRPAFEESFSPELPLGLNLGIQLYWLQTRFPEQFAQSTDILLYPQYWAWRLCGVRASEVTSLGCHTDLWNTREQCFSTLVAKQDWQHRFPPIQPAWQALAPVRAELAERWGLNENTHVYNGVHDSNASLLRYLHSDKEANVISTGTWTIAMSTATPLSLLHAERDMLANTAINQKPVACSRFMGGREYEAICQQLGSPVTSVDDEQALEELVESGMMALPGFASGTGPFASRRGSFDAHVNAGHAPALATLYCALLMDYQLDLLGCKGDIYIEGSFLKNPMLCAVLAQLRSDDQIWLSLDTTGTVRGCASLPQWPRNEDAPDCTLCSPTQLKGLDVYRARWRERAENVHTA